MIFTGPFLIVIDLVKLSLTSKLFRSLEQKEAICWKDLMLTMGILFLIGLTILLIA